MTYRLKRVLAGFMLLLGMLALAACGGADSSLYVPDLLARAGDYSGKDVTVSGALLDKGGARVLVLGVSTLDNGLDAQALGEQIWLEGFPEPILAELHNPGDAIYGFVRVTGRFESGGSYGTDGAFKHRIAVTAAEPIERVRRTEVRIQDQPLGVGKVSLFELTRDPAAYNGQQVTTQGYYFWNSVIYVLAEGVSTEEDGSSPQPVGQVIWMEGFPPDVSGQLNVGPNTSYVWGKVEVTGQFTSGGGFGKDGAYGQQLVLDPGSPASAKALEPKQ
jgi:hypothetical protein